MSLARGGCDQSLKKLILNGNCTFTKIGNTDPLAKFIKSVSVLSHLELSAAKLPSTIIQ